MISLNDLSETDRQTLELLKGLFNKIPARLIEARYVKALNQAKGLWPELQYKGE